MMNNVVDRVSIRQAGGVTGAVGLLVVIGFAAGVHAVVAVPALVHQCFLVGLPLALSLRSAIRAPQVVLALAFPLSVALTALSVQFLVWFEWATPMAIVGLSSLYGAVLGLLLDPGDAGLPAVGGPDPAGGSAR